MPFQPLRPLSPQQTKSILDSMLGQIFGDVESRLKAEAKPGEDVRIFAKSYTQTGDDFVRLVIEDPLWQEHIVRDVVAYEHATFGTMLAERSEFGTLYPYLPEWWVDEQGGVDLTMPMESFRNYYSAIIEHGTRKGEYLRAGPYLSTMRQMGAPAWNLVGGAQQVVPMDNPATMASVFSRAVIGFDIGIKDRAPGYAQVLGRILESETGPESLFRGMVMQYTQGEPAMLRRLGQVRKEELGYDIYGYGTQELTYNWQKRQNVTESLRQEAHLFTLKEGKLVRLLPENIMGGTEAQRAGYRWLNAIMPGESQVRSAYIAPRTFMTTTPVSGAFLMHEHFLKNVQAAGYGKTALVNVPFANLEQLDKIKWEINQKLQGMRYYAGDIIDIGKMTFRQGEEEVVRPLQYRAQEEGWISGPIQLNLPMGYVPGTGKGTSISVPTEMTSRQVRGVKQALAGYKSPFEKAEQTFPGLVTDWSREGIQLSMPWTARTDLSAKGFAEKMGMAQAARPVGGFPWEELSMQLGAVSAQLSGIAETPKAMVPQFMAKFASMGREQMYDALSLLSGVGERLSDYAAVMYQLAEGTGRERKGPWFLQKGDYRLDLSMTAQIWAGMRKEKYEHGLTENAMFQEMMDQMYGLPAHESYERFGEASIREPQWANYGIVPKYEKMLYERAFMFGAKEQGMGLEEAKALRQQMMRFEPLAGVQEGLYKWSMKQVGLFGAMVSPLISEFRTRSPKLSLNEMLETSQTLAEDVLRQLGLHHEQPRLKEPPHVKAWRQVQEVYAYNEERLLAERARPGLTIRPQNVRNILDYLIDEGGRPRVDPAKLATMSIVELEELFEGSDPNAPLWHPKSGEILEGPEAIYETNIYEFDDPRIGEAIGKSGKLYSKAFYDFFWGSSISESVYLQSMQGQRKQIFKQLPGEKSEVIKELQGTYHPSMAGGRYGFSPFPTIGRETLKNILYRTNRANLAKMSEEHKKMWREGTLVAEQIKDIEANWEGFPIEFFRPPGAGRIEGALPMLALTPRMVKRQYGVDVGEAPSKGREGNPFLTVPIRVPESVSTIQRGDFDYDMTQILGLIRYDPNSTYGIVAVSNQELADKMKLSKYREDFELAQQMDNLDLRLRAGGGKGLEGSQITRVLEEVIELQGQQASPQLFDKFMENQGRLLKMDYQWAFQMSRQKEMNVYGAGNIFNIGRGMEAAAAILGVPEWLIAAGNQGLQTTYERFIDFSQPFLKKSRSGYLNIMSYLQSVRFQRRPGDSNYFIGMLTQPIFKEHLLEESDVFFPHLWQGGEASFGATEQLYAALARDVEGGLAPESVAMMLYNEGVDPREFIDRLREDPTKAFGWLSEKATFVPPGKPEFSFEMTPLHLMQSALGTLRSESKKSGEIGEREQGVLGAMGRRGIRFNVLGKKVNVGQLPYMDEISTFVDILNLMKKQDIIGPFSLYAVKRALGAAKRMTGLTKYLTKQFGWQEEPVWTEKGTGALVEGAADIAAPPLDSEIEKRSIPRWRVNVDIEGLLKKQPPAMTMRASGLGQTRAGWLLDLLEQERGWKEKYPAKETQRGIEFGEEMRLEFPGSTYEEAIQAEIAGYTLTGHYDILTGKGLEAAARNLIEVKSFSDVTRQIPQLSAYVRMLEKLGRKPGSQSFLVPPEEGSAQPYQIKSILESELLTEQELKPEIERAIREKQIATRFWRTQQALIQEAYPEDYIPLGSYKERITRIKGLWGGEANWPLVKGYQFGRNDTVFGPEMFVVGESGPEDVLIRPLGRRGGVPPSGPLGRNVFPVGYTGGGGSGGQGSAFPDAEEYGKAISDAIGSRLKEILGDVFERMTISGELSIAGGSKSRAKQAVDLANVMATITGFPTGTDELPQAGTVARQALALYQKAMGIAEQYYGKGELQKMGAVQQMGAVMGVLATTEEGRGFLVSEPSNISAARRGLGVLTRGIAAARNVGTTEQRNLLEEYVDAEKNMFTRSLAFAEGASILRGTSGITAKEVVAKTIDQISELVPKYKELGKAMDEFIESGGRRGERALHKAEVGIERDRAKITAAAFYTQLEELDAMKEWGAEPEVIAAQEMKVEQLGKRALGAAKRAREGTWRGSLSAATRRFIGGWGMFYMGHLVGLGAGQFQRGYQEYEQYAAAATAQAQGMFGIGEVAPYDSPEIAYRKAMISMGGGTWAGWRRLNAELSMNFPIGDIGGAVLSGMGGMGLSLYAASNFAGLGGVGGALSTFFSNAALPIGLAVGGIALGASAYAAYRDPTGTAERMAAARLRGNDLMAGWEGGKSLLGGFINALATNQTLTGWLQEYIEVQDRADKLADRWGMVMAGKEGLRGADTGTLVAMARIAPTSFTENWEGIEAGYQQYVALRGLEESKRTGGKFDEAALKDIAAAMQAGRTDIYDFARKLSLFRGTLELPTTAEVRELALAKGPIYNQIEAGLGLAQQVPGIMAAPSGMRGVSALQNIWAPMAIGPNVDLYMQAQAVQALQYNLGMTNVGLLNPEPYTRAMAPERRWVISQQTTARSSHTSSQQRLMAMGAPRAAVDEFNQYFTIASALNPGQAAQIADWENRFTQLDPMAITQAAIGQIPGMEGLVIPGMDQYALADLDMQGDPTGLRWGTSSLRQGGWTPQQVGNRIWGEFGRGSFWRDAAEEGFTIPGTGVKLFGERGAQASIAQLRYDAQMAGMRAQMGQIGIQFQQLQLGYAFQTGIGLEAYQTVNPVTGEPFNIPAGGIWGVQDRQMRLGWRQAEWSQEMQQRQQAMNWGQFQMQGRQFYENLALQQTQTLMQRAWTREDWGYQDMVREMQWGWKQEDFEENIRFMSGRERRLAERSMKRETTMYGIEGERIDTQRSRQQELWKLEDQRFELTKRHFEEQRKWQEEGLKLQDENIKKQREFYEESKKLQTESQELQRAYYIENHKLQEAQLGAAAGALAAQMEYAEQLKEAQDGMLIFGQYVEDSTGRLRMLGITNEWAINEIARGLGWLGKEALALLQGSEGRFEGWSPPRDTEGVFQDTDDTTEGPKQFGGSFEIGPGHGNDSLNLKVSSGERITVSPATGFSSMPTILQSNNVMETNTGQMMVLIVKIGNETLKRYVIDAVAQELEV